MTILSPNTLITANFASGQVDFAIDPPDFQVLVSSLAGISVQTAKTADYTIALTDIGTLIPMNSASAHTFFINTDAAVNFDIGSIVYFWRRGAGTLTITATTPGTTTLLTPTTATALDQYAIINALKTAANEWLLGGRLT